MTVKQLRDPDEILAEASEDQEVEEQGPIHAFELDVQGERGKRWRGEFVFHVPTIGDQITITSLRDQYTTSQAGVGVGYAQMIAYLGVTLKKKPSWWKPLTFYDPTPLLAVYEEAISHEAKFHGRDEESREGSGDVAKEQSAASRETVVERDVQPAPQRREVIASHGT